MQSDGPALYEYRPLVRGFVEEREGPLRGREDALLALEELRREPAADLRARPRRAASRRRTTRSSGRVLLGLLLSRPPSRAVGSTGTTRRSSAPTPSSSARCSASVVRTAPSRRCRCRSRHAARARPGFASARPRRRAGASLAGGAGLLPPRFGTEADRYCVLELRATLDADEDVPDAPAEIADAVSALRLATAGPLAAGPVLFETLDGRPVRHPARAADRCHPAAG